MLQTLSDSKLDSMLERITEVVHDDTRYLKGALGMRTQKCFAVKVMRLFSKLIVVNAMKHFHVNCGMVH